MVSSSRLGPTKAAKVSHSRHSRRDRAVGGPDLAEASARVAELTTAGARIRGLAQPHALTVALDAKWVRLGKTSGPRLVSCRCQMGPLWGNQTARRRRGSSASRTPSPMKLQAMTRVRMARPGKTPTHHWSKLWTPAATMAPHSGAGGGEPRPRKLRPENVRIALPRSSVAMTTAGARQLGSTTLVRMCGSDAPMARDAWTYSFSLTDRTSPRVTRA